MLFTRTSKGIENTIFFAKADAIVFIEGGPVALSFQDESEPTKLIASLDAAYWEAVFNTCFSGKTFKFRPMGGKENLVKLCDKIIKDNIKNVFVAMDADYDHYFE